ncbi:MAG TPA: nucleoside phosphorylase [Desulfotignum sp.]|nr:nucleoside phosphorylase [Desulfotignum sp.]
MNYPAWLDLNEASLVPPLGTRQAPDLGPVAVMVSTPADFKLFKAGMGRDRIIPFFLSSLILDQQKIAVTGPFVGSAYAAMLMESLHARGVTRIIVLGWCGSLTESLQTGDLVLPTAALVDEGTSRHYAALDPDVPASFPDEALCLRLADNLFAQGVACTREMVWTTDAIYRETPKKIAWFKSQGAAAVEMECSALFSVAAFRNIQVAALLVVSDSLAAGNWAPGFKKQRFKTARQDACRAVLSFVRTLV